MRYLIGIILICFFSANKGFSQSDVIQKLIKTDKEITVGAKRLDIYLPWLKDKNIGIIANQTSVIGKTHLVDSLVLLGVNVKTIFCPEHGFRGNSGAGEYIKNGVDTKTGISIVSLYGKDKKPSAEMLSNIDVIVFDIQDVGARFYTYISTMSYAMEACAENNKTFIVLDRPNPNGHYIAGPILEKEYKSFVGLHPVPIVHGMTIAEYAKMVNGEGWLKNGVKCDLKYVTCLGYQHNYLYQLPIAPSPNLQTMNSIYLYPSLCLFEGTDISIGRGTETPFEVIGHPKLKDTVFSFTPISITGVSKNPKHKNVKCYGHDLSKLNPDIVYNYKEIYLLWITSIYHDFPEKEKFFNNFFNKLAGNSSLKQQIIDKVPISEIKANWENNLLKYEQMRSQYLLYKDFRKY